MMIKKLISNFIWKNSVKNEHVRFGRFLARGWSDSCINEVEEKAFSGKGSYSNSLFDYNESSLAASLALEYYAKIQPVQSSVDMITEELSSIIPVVQNTKTDQISYEHPVLNVLKVPNPFCKSYEEFIKTVALNYLVTGNAFVVVTGNIKSPAQELYEVNPREVYLDIGEDGFVADIRVNSNSENIVFHRVYAESNGRRVARYINSNNREIFHIKNNNPHGCAYSPWGFARVTALIYEMEQYLHSNKHNLSLLIKGARPSMAIWPKNFELTDEQFVNLDQGLKSRYSGSSNAGEMLVFQREFDAKEMSISNKDMDYESLRRNVISAIYTHLGVPLPLVMPEQMTLANMQAAMSQFYQKTVIPTANRIFAELTDMLMGRYKDQEKSIITFNRRAIPALEFEAVEALKTKASLNVMTDNEIRTDLGLEQVSGGNVLYKPNNVVPASELTNEDKKGETSKNDTNDNQILENEEQKSALNYLIEKMKSIKNEHNERVYSDKHIESVVKKHNLADDHN